MIPQIALFLILSFLVNGSGFESGFEPEIGNFTCSQDFVTPDRIFSLSAIVSDLDGRETLENASIELSEGIILLWRNETDAFSMIQNQQGYTRLESGSYSKILNSSALTLTFHLSYYVNMSEGGVSVLPSGTRVYDNSSLYGSGNYSSLFVFGPEPESWQQKPYPLQPTGRVIGFEESVVIFLVFMVIIAVVTLFSKREKSTQEKYHDLIDVQPKKRNIND